MDRDDAQGREIQALRDRLARLSEVSLRINERTVRVCRLFCVSGTPRRLSR